MQMRQKQGFTIVELLIVVVVIAILAAITIVAYNGIQNRANDTAVKSDVSSFAKKIELVKVSGDTYPASLSSLTGFKASQSSYASSRNNFYYCISPTADRFALGVISKSGEAYLYVSGQGMTNPSGVSGASVCSQVGQGSWDSTYTYTQLGHNYDQPGTRGWATWL